MVQKLKKKRLADTVPIFQLWGKLFKQCSCS
jgi:hypothetical protein